ncbi:hypothetical protein A2Y83_04505 [Candidatus Falkowbacteria bacterium RBG_13_39_14]|uniref:Uncharacterized protein n=1 Tax=Candidatus Falkowbacteria bacterium RBG_13_39_14 TaxID=1797985 RepID=A0A1F5S4C2_9BACT|nr:MAG: hypothetical protein A2Y83_04505 [Candidatus Falkowbacteria bacterium RBG_13_39_14]
MGEFEKFLEEAKKTFVCLRCGECCFAWEVRMPDGSRKPERQNCKFLAPRQRVDGKWKQSSCSIHGNSEMPQECAAAIFSPSCCQMGVAIWGMVKKQYPSDKLPDIVEEAFQEGAATKIKIFG